ncbi:MAG: NUDIX domain-containing protein [Planctomycetes bacterium]|nr:NUDIX domain-containing protein [Planctomycetota bacterium]
MTSDLQIRSEKARQRYDANPRKPIILEFAGVPKAGKTSTITQIQTFLKRCGFRVEVVVERASVCPIRDKKHFNFNVWTAATTLAQILEKTQDPPRAGDPQILILDRGLFDSICWLSVMQELRRINSNDRELIEKFLLIDDWRKRVTGVIVMTVNPEDAMKREKGHLPVEDLESTGSIMNPKVLTQMRNTVKRTIERMESQFTIKTFDTSAGTLRDDPQKTAEVVADTVINWIEEQIQEDILFLEKSDIQEFFGSSTTLLGDAASSLVSRFLASGQYRPRQEVEANHELVQALPVVVVRNRSGAVLRLRRCERDKENLLHEKLVIWAGGHVRSEDDNGNAIRNGAVRELQEELRLTIEPEELEFLGAVYVDPGKQGKTRQHTALVFEWRANSEDVEVTLSTAEFFERRGTSLSGKFIDLETLTTEVNNDSKTEPWTEEIVKNLLPDSLRSQSQELF